MTLPETAAPETVGAATGTPRRRRRIAHLTSVHPPLDSRIFHKEATALVRAGYEVVVVAAHDRDDLIEGVRIRAVAAPRHGRRSRMTGTVRAVWRAALDEDADLYHFHDPELIPLGIRLKLAGKRVVYDVHEDLPRQILNKPWIKPWLRHTISRGAELVEDASIRFFDAVVTTTPTIARRFPARQTVIVQNYPILKELEVPQEAPYSARDPLLVYVGSLSLGRGARQMVEAMSALPGTLDARLTLAGTFDPEVEAICRDLPGWQSVTFLGWQSRPQVAAILARARIGIVTLLPLPNYLDAFPVKLFEYMAAGLPVVASDFPLWRRIIEDAGCGLLVDPAEPEEIAAACRHLLEHPAEAEAMGRRGRAAVSRIYNWDVAAKELLLLYQRLLDETPGQGPAAAGQTLADAAGHLSGEKSAI